MLINRWFPVCILTLTGQSHCNSISFQKWEYSLVKYILKILIASRRVFKATDLEYWILSLENLIKNWEMLQVSWTWDLDSRNKTVYHKEETATSQSKKKKKVNQFIHKTTLPSVVGIAWQTIRKEKTVQFLQDVSNDKVEIHKRINSQFCE